MTKRQANRVRLPPEEFDLAGVILERLPQASEGKTRHQETGEERLAAALTDTTIWALRVELEIVS